MKKIICNTILLSALLISIQSQAQHLLEALDAPLFSSTQTKNYSRNFTKNNCSAGYTGGTVTYTQTATASATSEISQADADSKASAAATAEAQRLVNEGGQAYANENAKCIPNDGGGGGLVLTPKCSPAGSIRERSRTFSRVQSVCQGGVYHMITYYHVSFDVCTTVNGGLGYSWLDWQHYTTTETATSNTPTTIKCTQ